MPRTPWALDGRMLNQFGHSTILQTSIHSSLWANRLWSWIFLGVNEAPNSPIPARLPSCAPRHLLFGNRSSDTPKGERESWKLIGETRSRQERAETAQDRFGANFGKKVNWYSTLLIKIETSNESCGLWNLVGSLSSRSSTPIRTSNIFFSKPRVSQERTYAWVTHD